MKRLSAFMAVLALVLGAGIAFADGSWSGSGEIVELGCYKSRNATGADHAACAKKCLSDGKAMGLLQEDGSIINLTKGSDEAAYSVLIDLAGKMAKVEGTEADGAVTVTAGSAG